MAAFLQLFGCMFTCCGGEVREMTRRLRKRCTKGRQIGVKPWVDPEDSQPMQRNQRTFASFSNSTKGDLLQKQADGSRSNTLTSIEEFYYDDSTDDVTINFDDFKREKSRFKRLSERCGKFFHR